MIDYIKAEQEESSSNMDSDQELAIESLSIYNIYIIMDRIYVFEQSLVYMSS